MDEPTARDSSLFELEAYRTVRESAADELRLVYNMFTWGTLSCVAIAGWLAGNVAVVADLGLTSRLLWWVPLAVLLLVTLGLLHSAGTLKSHHDYLFVLESRLSPEGIGWHGSKWADSNARRAIWILGITWISILAGAFFFGLLGPELFGPQPTHVVYESVPPSP
jgi:hypothetical protein